MQTLLALRSHRALRKLKLEHPDRVLFVAFSVFVMIAALGTIVSYTITPHAFKLTWPLFAIWYQVFDLGYWPTPTVGDRTK